MARDLDLRGNPTAWGASDRRRVRVEVRGAVQGVGFRPFVYQTATALGLTGFVSNEPAGVRIEAEGDAAAVDGLLRLLREQPPPMARVESIEAEEAAPEGGSGFFIRESGAEGGRRVMVAPDMAVCVDCLREMRDPADRRHRYAFINCTNCGPRYTIIRDLPYDRARTTMADFPMCGACRTEYEDPSNRRFHAEPTCCSACGPRLWVCDADGADLATADPVAAALDCIAAGGIVAVKGLGGFHLACDAADEDAVRRLRARKHRDLKPFAVMAADLDVARRIALMDEVGERLLTGPEAPIVLLEKAPGHGLAEAVAPRARHFGVMLPYTPLHHLLMEGRARPLVMTSGNLSQEPIVQTNAGAVERLRGIADAFLLHDRDIHIRTDDSVVRVALGEAQFLRRSRGYAPFPLPLPSECAGGGEVLAVGPELSNTVCLTREGYGYVSHHVGDLENAAAYEGFLQAVDHLGAILAVEPAAVACDRHPRYLSTRWARESGRRIEYVQHHHAHLASVLAEHGRSGPAMGIIFDGIGWGEDDAPWGGEFLHGGLAESRRWGHLRPVPQPGGDAAARRTPRMAYAMLQAAMGEEAEALCRELMPLAAEEEWRVTAQLVQSGLNTPMTSSMGRMFDAAAAVLGICFENTYHAQAPMELEAAAWAAAGERGEYACAIVEENGRLIAETPQIIAALARDRLDGTDATICAARFHNAIARLSLDMCRMMRDNGCGNTAALSGGVFANAWLVERLAPMLEADGFDVLRNTLLPPGDGGVSFGQAAAASARLMRKGGESGAPQ